MEVRLVVRKYVEKGSSVTLQCEHNVAPKILYKVSKKKKTKETTFMRGMKFEMETISFTNW